MTALLSRLIRASESPWAPGVLFLLALALRAVVAAATSDFTPGVEIWEYGQQATCAAQHARDLCLWDGARQPYISALMPPLTSYLWLGLFAAFGMGAAPHVVYVSLNVLMGAACTPLLYKLAREIGLERGPACLAGLIITGYPTFVFVSAGYHATNFTVALMLSFLILLVRVARDFDWKAALAAGLVGGLAALTRNELLVIAAAATLLVLWLGRKHLAIALQAAAALTLGVGLVTAPWIARNYIAFHSFIPIGAQAGYNVWIGFGPYARGSGNQLDNDPEARAAAAVVREGVAPGDPPESRFEPRLQRAFLDDAQPALREGGLGRIAGLTAQRLTLLWIFDWTDPITRSPGYWLPWLVAHALALWGVIMVWRKRASIEPNAGAFITLFLVVFTLAYSVSSIFVRYRMHMEPFIFLFAAIGAWSVLARWKRD